MDGRADRLGGEYLRVKFSPPHPPPPKDVLSSIAVMVLLLGVFSAFFLLWRARLADLRFPPFMNRTCTSSMYTLTYEQITRDFHVSTVVATLGLSLFVMG